VPDKSILELYNSVGQIVSKEVLTPSNISIKVDLTPGIYFYRIVDNNKYPLKSGRIIFK